jgi:hypothetical protein
MMKMFLSFAAAFAVTVSGAASDLAGTWRVAVAFDAASRSKNVPAKVELVCAFAQRDDVVTGECRPADGPDGIAIHGKAHANSVEWSFEIALNDADRKEPVTFTGRVSDDGTSLTGTFAIADYRGTFTAHRE